MNNSRKALGRGLAALIPQAASGAADGVQEIPVSEIIPNPQQPRRYFDPESLAELVESIKAHGMLEPVIVRPKNGCYELVVGERRYRAAKEAKFTSIPAIVRELDDRQALEMAIVENVQRSDLNAIEEAEAYLRLAQEFGLTQEQIAERVGKQRSTVANRLRLLELEPEIQSEVQKGNISAGHARALLAVSESATRLRLARECTRTGLSVRQMEELARKAAGDSKRKRKVKKTETPGVLADLAEQMQRVLGTRVRIVHQGSKGQIQIEFYDDEDITRIYELIVGEEQLA